jgi:hypothetical protein
VVQLPREVAASAPRPYGNPACVRLLPALGDALVSRGRVMVTSRARC